MNCRVYRLIMPCYTFQALHFKVCAVFLNVISPLCSKLFCCLHWLLFICSGMYGPGKSFKSTIGIWELSTPSRSWMKTDALSVPLTTRAFVSGNGKFQTTVGQIADHSALVTHWWGGTGLIYSLNKPCPRAMAALPPPPHAWSWLLNPELLFIILILFWLSSALKRPQWTGRQWIAVLV